MLNLALSDHPPHQVKVGCAELEGGVDGAAADDCKPREREEAVVRR